MIITVIKSYYGAPQLVLRSASKHKLQLRGMATLPQGNQELLVARDKVGRPPGDLGVSKSTSCLPQYDIM